MLATLVPKPFDKPGWIYEEKYDGYRILAYKEGTKVTLLSRNAKDRTEAFLPVAKPWHRSARKLYCLMAKWLYSMVKVFPASSFCKS